ncbi:hypothetical protein PsorP6_000041 [Peronosclerospora sorghi]|uniref:Uncharacterized protein n=1 Tax=Peronosclerospora sorghi TaxID=230839 RepID=A0ACC0WRM3_9STRA|nr:hypothetical protein PsorP6_000041 [Peronosclerospora sorghi]
MVRISPNPKTSKTSSKYKRLKLLIVLGVSLTKLLIGIGYPPAPPTGNFLIRPIRTTKRQLCGQYSATKTPRSTSKQQILNINQAVHSSAR